LSSVGISSTKLRPIPIGKQNNQRKKTKQKSEDKTTNNEENNSQQGADYLHDIQELHGG
jgi:hypothetical protein